jgi:hypothetical protein
MNQRRYTDDEVAAIFERAATEQQTAPRQLAPAEGLTLAQLHDIGREVGISAEEVTRAARSLELAGHPVSRSVMGLPLRVGRTVELPRRLTDGEWEQVVADLRDTFQASGSLRYDGSFREWSNGNLSVMLEPTPTGHRVRMRTASDLLRQLLGAGLVLTGMGSLLSFLLIAQGKAEGLALTGFLVATGIGTMGLGAVRLRGWASLRQRQMEGLAGRIALLAESPPSRGSLPAQGR